MNNDGAVAATPVLTDLPYEVDREVVEVPMADGVLVSVKLWRPRHDRPTGTILEAIPYRKDDVSVLDDETRFGYFAGHGYVCARMDLRGSGSSGGVLLDEYSTQEQRDICEVVAWLAARPWSNGNVGMVGISWSGFNSLQVAALRPPALKAVISEASTDDRFATDVHYLGGSPLGFYMNLWGSELHLYNMRPPRSDVAAYDDWRSEWRTRLRSNVDYTALWLSHARKDAYWQQGSVQFTEGGLGCPALMVGGWADAYTDAAFRVQARQPDSTRLLIGAWGHTWPERPEPGPGIDFLAFSRRWWDHWLLGEENGIEDDPAHTFYLQEFTPSREDLDHRPGTWLAVDRPEDVARAATPRVLHPTADGRLAADRPAAAAVRHEGSLRVGARARHMLPMGVPTDLPVVQDEDDARSLCFDLEVGDDGLEILGQVELALTTVAATADASVFVRLCDVDPDGHSHLVSWGNLNLAHRDGSLPEQVRPLRPGEPEEWRLRLKHTAYRFAPGHRLRLAVSTAYWPWIWPLPDLVDLDVLVGPSTVVLPVLDRSVVRPLDAADLGTPVIAPAPELEKVDESTAYWRSEEPRPGHLVTAKGHAGYSSVGSPAEGWRLGVLEDDAEWEVEDGDPLSAVMTRRCAQEFAWDGHEATIRLTSRMSCDRDTFTVEIAEEAVLDGELFHRASSTHVVPRDHH
ncbi:CocE/NonD family hydrolase [Nocardioides sp. GY 10127]|uniref:CocE/NonD family hydrolase n=1 Tax=Nocardioides sp. GY 10127 TaxID=2569762 RepID=UPI001F0FFF07|nr:CocE/NonD family hydrolase [Nocardioides sp. GY 10127]